MWIDLNDICKEAFSLAWESFKKNTIPIGAVIVDEQGNIISRGRNRIFDETSNNPLDGTYMAHAEMTAMLNLKVARCTQGSAKDPRGVKFGNSMFIITENLIKELS